MDEVSKLVAGVWIVRDLYEVVPNTYTTQLTQSRAWMQTFRAIGLIKITGVAWYRSLAGGDPPESLSVWERFTHARAWKTTDVPDNGSVGWQEVDLSASPLYFQMDANRILGVGAYSGVDGRFAAADQTVNREGGVPASIPLQSAYFHDNAGDVFPDSIGTGRIYGLDMRAELASPVSSVSADVEYELSRWMSEAGDHYNDSRLPFIAGQAAGANEAAQDAVTAIVAQQSDVNVLLSRLTEDVAAKLTVFLNDYGIDARGFFDQITAQVQDVSDAQADIIIWFGEYTGIPIFTYLGNLLKFLNGVNSPPQLAEGDDWELVDETDFTNNLLWPVEADLYRVTLSDFDPAGTSEQVGTETRHAYLGKWCPFNVQFSSEWHYFNTASADLYLGGRMPGLGLILYRPGAGHVQAWRRVEAP